MRWSEFDGVVKMHHGVKDRLESFSGPLSRIAENSLMIFMRTLQ